MIGSGQSWAIAPRLIGVWRLVSYTDQQKGHPDSFPLGSDPEGFLIYTPDGFVSAQLMRAVRGKPQEDGDMGREYIAYCGVYEVDEAKETVTHTPSVALQPSLILKGQVRSMTLNEDRLSLRFVSESAVKGRSVTSRLEWQRASTKAMDRVTAI
jgi:hypothetical protein